MHTSLPHRRLIGILGGMGPAATIDFMAKIIAATPAGVDQEHVPLIVHDVPQIPDRSAAIHDRSDGPFPPMLAGLRLLERSGVEAIAIPCNTAHFWYDRLARACGVRILHIADAVIEHLRARPQPTRRLALMATRGTIATGIYQPRLQPITETLIIPPEPVQDLIDRAIAAVKGGHPAAAAVFAEQAGQALLDAGADGLLLACTELPVALSGSTVAPYCLDATQALAQACVLASLPRDTAPVLPLSPIPWLF